MTRRHGCALLTAVLALIVVVSAVLHAGTASDTRRRPAGPFAGGRTPTSSAAPVSTGTWVGAWAAAPAAAEPGTELHGMAGRSVRNVVHASVAGTSARITLSNLYGRSPLHITHASIAIAAREGSAAAAAGTMRRLTFSGAASVRVPPGGQVTSDAVRIAVPRGADVLVTTYSPASSGPVTHHPRARQISYVAAGDRTEDTTGAPYTERTTVWRHLTALDVLSTEAEGTVVVLGDSLTDGITSTVNANRRWTDVLARRIRAAVERGRDDVPRYSVVNEGISGNRVLTSGLGRPADNPSGMVRFERDVLERTGVEVVVIALGINDILRSPRPAGPDEITAGLRALVERAHARGLKVVGATLMPFEGHRRYTPEREAVRQQVNAEIRSGRVFDAVVDFDRALRDPYAPRRLRPVYDSGDHLHPSDQGYRRMAEVFDLRELKGAVPATL
ncbi:SGNH/GDSL hydrolase family protein [Streptomyces thermovulgaris]|uniref:SGNH/GDSL hydrolase family protein n=1 Tax=Streptomyces thermovulgaris TaxID=1934 RepID=UPI000A3804FF|nr:SGNH/GDSL hydrolase family protein [Streptomyces thermovulgaris]